MPPAIELFIRNWKTTAPGLTMIGGALYQMYMRYQTGQSWLPTEVELTAIAAGIIGLYAKAHNVTGGDTSNGLTPDPVQEAKAQIAVTVANAPPAVLEKAPIDLVSVAKIKQDLLDLQAKLEKALSGQ